MGSRGRGLLYNYSSSYTYAVSSMLPKMEVENKNFSDLIKPLVKTTNLGWKAAVTTLSENAIRSLEIYKLYRERPI